LWLSLGGAIAPPDFIEKERTFPWQMVSLWFALRSQFAEDCHL